MILLKVCKRPIKQVPHVGLPPIVRITPLVAVHIEPEQYIFLNDCFWSTMISDIILKATSVWYLEAKIIIRSYND